MKTSKFKCRASKAGDLMTNGRAKNSIGQTCITMLKEWLITDLTGKTKDISSKYLTHGIVTEDLAIQRISKYYGQTFTKNEVQLENEYFTGTFDACSDVLVVDAKSSFSPFTFPYFDAEPPKGYYNQVQVYLDLTGLQKGAVAFCLENGTEEEIEKLAWQIAKREAIQKGIEDFEMEIEHWNQANEQLNYDHLPEWMRIKVYEFDRNEELIQQMKDRVVDCREIIENELLTELMNIKF